MKKLILKLAKYNWTFLSPLFYRNNRPEDSPNRILITKFDRLGDFFLLIPFLQQLLNKGIEIFVVSLPQNKEIIDHLKIPVTFFPFDNSNHSNFKKLLSVVRKTPFSHAFNLSMNIWGGFLVNQSNSTHKIGLLQEREHYVYKGASLFYDKILSYAPDTHSFNVLVSVFRELSGLIDFNPSIENEFTVKEKIVIHPFASWQPRQWPHFLSLIDSLIAKGYKVEILGTSKELSDYTVPDHFRNNPELCIIKLSSIKELLNHIDQCKAFIGNDSGPAHYAALLGKPVTVIWGPGYFERIHPIGKNVQFCMLPMTCRPCRQNGKTCKRGDNICLQDISVEMVIEKFEKSIKTY